jgi:hypothetical protein
MKDAIASHLSMLDRLGKGKAVPEGIEPGPDRCPLCSEENHCAIANGKGSPASCWCFTEPVPMEVVAQFQHLPPEERVCVCQTCARKGRR